MHEQKKDDRAVALSYNKNEDSAPKILVKGGGELAALIINKAVEWGVTVIEDPDLVEVLYNLPEGIEIPEDLYKMIAELYVFLYKSSKKFREIPT